MVTTGYNLVRPVETQCIVSNLELNPNLYNSCNSSTNSYTNKIIGILIERDAKHCVCTGGFDE